MNALKITSFIICSALCLLAMCCVTMLFNANLSTYQQCFLVVTMNASGLLILAFNKTTK